VKAKQIESWRETRKKGCVRFILLNGLLAWGLPMVVVMAFISEPFSEGFTTRGAVAHCLIWGFAGILFGTALWWFSERRYGPSISRKTTT
jgi:hypothetical protein